MLDHEEENFGIHKIYFIRVIRCHSRELPKEEKKRKETIGEKKKN